MATLTSSHRLPASRTPRTRLKPYHVLAALAVSVGLSGISVTGLVSPQVSVASGSISVVIGALVGLAVYVQQTGTRVQDLWLTVPGLFWGVASVTLGLAALAWIGPEGQSDRTSAEGVAVALRVAAVWIWASVLGYWWTAPRLRFSSPLDRFDGLTERFKGGGTIAYLVGMAAIAYLIGVGRFSFVSGVDAAFSATSSIPQIAISITYGTTLGAVVVLWKGLTSANMRLTTAGLAMFGLAGAVQLYGGMKEPVLITGFALFATLRIAYGRLPRFSIIIGIVLVLSTFAFVNPYRQGVRYSGLSPFEAATRTISDIGSQGATTLVGDTLGALFDRLRDVDSIAIIVEKTPESIGYSDPTEIPSGVAAVLVPRSIWPSKPIVADGRDFAIEYLGFSRSTDVAIAVTTAGDSYRYGGWAATAVLGLLLGAYIAVLDRALRPTASPAALLMFVPMAVSLAQSGNGIVVTAASQLKTFAVTWVIMWLVIAGVRSHGATPRSVVLGS